MAEVTTAQILRHARTLIDQPSKHCRGWFANGNAGQRLSEHDNQATSFCAIGAVNRTVFTELKIEGIKASELFAPLAKAAEKILSEHPELDYDSKEYDCIPYLNDNLGFDATLRMFDLAIEEAEGNVASGV